MSYMAIVGLCLACLLVGWLVGSHSRGDFEQDCMVRARIRYDPRLWSLHPYPKRDKFGNITGFDALPDDLDMI